MHVKVRVGPRETWIAGLPESLRHEFSQDELEQMQEQFCDFDESGDGSIAAAELVVLMKSMGIDATLDEVQGLIDKVDDNRSGELEFPEFVRLISEFRRGNGDKLAAFIQYSKLALAIRRELHDLQRAPTALSTVRAVRENAWEWRVETRGPPATPYDGGHFVFRIEFGREYPYAAPTVLCLTRIYHPNFVPLLNGTMTIAGFLDAWAPEGGRMRGLLERLERLLAEPDVDLLNAFYDDTMRQLGNLAAEDDDNNDDDDDDGDENSDHQRRHRQSQRSPQRRRLRHPRELTLECIDLFVTDPEGFAARAMEMTRRCAALENRGE